MRTALVGYDKTMFLKIVYHFSGSHWHIRNSPLINIMIVRVNTCVKNRIKENKKMIKKIKRTIQNDMHKICKEKEPIMVLVEN